MLDAVDKVAALRTESLVLRLGPLKYLTDTLLRLQSFQVIVAQVQLVGCLASCFALKITTLLDLRLLMLYDRLHLILKGLLQQDIVPIQIQGLIQTAHKALQRLIMLQIEIWHLRVAIEVQITQVIYIANGLNWRRGYIVVIIVVAVHQAHVKEFQLRH